MADGNQVEMGAAAPFFIVRDVRPSIAFYRDQLGFELAFAAPGEDPFFALLTRGAARLMVKAILPDVLPLPNPMRHPSAAWDAHVYTPNPDALAAEFSARGVTLRTPLGDTEDQLRGFEVQDPDGYVLFFGRPVAGLETVA
jgi:catechol 2,3-dioxygenase-like lactoylglutathione lyase family enzyme